MLDVGSSVAACQKPNVENAPFWYDGYNDQLELLHSSDTTMAVHVADRVLRFKN